MVIKYILMINSGTYIKLIMQNYTAIFTSSSRADVNLLWSAFKVSRCGSAFTALISFNLLLDRS